MKTFVHKAFSCHMCRLVTVEIVLYSASAALPPESVTVIVAF